MIFPDRVSGSPGTTRVRGKQAAAPPQRGRRHNTSHRVTKRAPSYCRIGCPIGTSARLCNAPALKDLPISARLPRLVARGYPAAVPGRPGSVTPFYVELSRLESPARDQCVISIDWPVYMRTPALRDESRLARRDASDTR